MIFKYKNKYQNSLFIPAEMSKLPKKERWDNRIENSFESLIARMLLLKIIIVRTPTEKQQNFFMEAESCISNFNIQKESQLSYQLQTFWRGETQCYTAMRNGSAVLGNVLHGIKLVQIHWNQSQDEFLNNPSEHERVMYRLALLMRGFSGLLRDLI